VLFFKSSKDNERTGALLDTGEGVASVVLQQRGRGKPVLLHCCFHSPAPGQTHADLLRRAVTESAMQKSRCTTLLQPHEYQLLMVEALEVPPQELKAAIRWRIRDLIDFHIDDAVLDVFDVPPSGARGVQEHLYTVVARAALIQEKVNALQSAGAALDIIDIPELALRNIAAQQARDANGQATVYFGADHGLVILSRDATLYLARNLDIGYRQILQEPGLVDHLALELQRSMDYYDRHFQQAAIAGITLCPLPVALPGLAAQLEQQTGISVSQLGLGDLVDTGTATSDAQFAQCFLAIGAALRTERREL
jgi:MSHA biogenesis protein MshI